MINKYTILVNNASISRGYFIPLLIFIMFTITFNSKVISSPALNMQVTGASVDIVNGIYVYVGLHAGASYYEKVVPGSTIYLYREWTAGSEWYFGIGLGGSYSETYYSALDIDEIALTPEGLHFSGLGLLGTGSNSSPTVTSTPLPVELTTFTAAISNNSVELSWQTATEVNNYGFEIERSVGSCVTQIASNLSNNEKWEKIAFIEGHGNSNSPKYYSYSDNSLESSGNYSYRLKQVDIDGTFEYSDVIEANLGLPKKFKLDQNYPNPFNPSTSISYSIPSDGRVTLAIYDILGNEVAQLENGNKSAGTYSHSFDASQLTSGIYFYTLSSTDLESSSGQDFVQTKKMLLMK